MKFVFSAYSYRLSMLAPCENIALTCEAVPALDVLAACCAWGMAEDVKDLNMALDLFGMAIFFLDHFFFAGNF
jgi:hypothetical protein